MKSLLLVVEIRLTGTNTQLIVLVDDNTKTWLDDISNETEEQHFITLII